MLLDGPDLLAGVPKARSFYSKPRGRSGLAARDDAWRREVTRRQLPETRLAEEREVGLL